MRIPWLPLVAGVVIAALDPSTAHACSQPYTPLFARFERAQTVLVARVTAAAPARGARLGRARLQPREAIAGALAPVVVHFGNSSCDVPLRRSRAHLLVFLSAEGTIADAESVVREPDAALLTALRAWAGASADEREAQLLAILDSAPADDRLAQEAAASVRDAGLRAGFSAAQLERLDAAAAAHGARRFDEALAQTYGTAASAFAAVAFADETEPDALAAVIRSGTETARIEAFERCGLRHGRVWHALGERDEASWELRARQCERGALQIDVALADVYRLAPADFAAHDFERETDTDALADAMAVSPGPAGFGRRAKAFERCTRLYDERVVADRDPATAAAARLELPWQLQGSFGPDTPQSQWRAVIAECRRGSRFLR